MDDVYITASTFNIERTQLSTQRCLVANKIHGLNTLVNDWTIITLFVDSVGTQDKDNKSKAEKEQHCEPSTS